MKQLVLTIKGEAVARVRGDDLKQRTGGGAAPLQWLAFSSLDLRVGDDWLHADVETSISKEDRAPDEIGMLHDEDRRTSSLVFDGPSGSKKSGEWEIIPVQPGVVFRFFWRNPLTPGHKGVWIRLTFSRVDKTWVITNGDTEREPVFWSWSAKASSWKGTALLSSMPQQRPPSELPALLNQFEYVDDDGSGCRLLTKQAPGWVVDVSNAKELRKGYRLGFLERDGDGIRPLVASFEASKGPYAVNLAIFDEGVSAATLDCDGVTLTCARKSSGHGFVLEWSGVGSGQPPGVEGPERLSLNTIYGCLARHYALGMAAVRSRNRLSFAPTSLHADTVRLHFDVASASTALRSALVDPKTRIAWVTGAAAATESQRVSLVFTQALVKSERSSNGPPALLAPSLRVVMAQANPPAHYLTLVSDQAEGGVGEWVVNGVLIGVDGLATAQLRLARAGDRRPYGQPPVAVDLALVFPSATLTPASDDPEIGFEVLSSWLKRERPIVIDLRDANPKVAVTIREFANASQSRVLRIAARSLGSERHDVDAVVLDPSPFTVARVVSRTEVEPNGLLAEYTDDSDQAPEWTFASTEGDMTAVLPPQVIGEEMIKGILHIGKEAVPFKDRPFDFRLSPPATLLLDRTDINTARTTAPWSLRRLLGQRPGVVGTKLTAAEFELLYGLLSRIEDVPGLRIAELDALVGRMPFPDTFLDILRASAVAGTLPSPVETLRATYCTSIAGHIRAMLYRPSWWPVFRDFTSRRQLIITGEGVHGALRSTRATANPFAIDKFHDFDETRAGSPLRGGVDWPFQSPNVYDELVGAPETSSLTLEGLAFGSLGGSGKQTAEFNNGKTLIISETTQGRLDSVTVIRIGRIAMLWNRARHVIVYERSTRRAPRYALGNDDGVDTWETQSPDFDGMAALRKVREYVEITEQKRAYPDSPATRPIAGPLKASFFETTIIPVKSTWGRDVRSGFVIALRGPLLDAEARFFPFPKIFLKNARARGKGEGTVDHQLKRPSELLFYTSTRREDGGDTDQWPPVPDVDFPIVRLEPPRMLPFASRFTRSRQQPDARGADFGQDRFTVTLEAPEEAVDLMHGRLSEGIDARVSSMSLARGHLAPEAAAQMQDVAKRTAVPMADAHARVHDGLGELRLQLAQAARDSGGTLGSLGSFAAEARQLVGDLKSTTAALATTLQGLPASDWTKEQDRWNERFQANRKSQVEAWKQQLNLSRVPSSDIARLGRSALDGVLQQIRQRADSVGFLPLAALNQIDAAEEALRRRLERLADESAADFDAALDAVAARYREMVQTEEAVSDGLPALQLDLDAALEKLQAALARADSDALAHLTDDLGRWFNAGGAGVIETVTRGLTHAVADLRFLVDGVAASIPPLEIEEPDWDHLKAAVRETLDAFAETAAIVVADMVAPLRGEIEKLFDAASGRLKALQESLDAIDDAYKQALADLEKNGTQALTDFLAAADTHLEGIGGKLKTVLGDLQKTAWGTAPGVFDHAKTLGSTAAAGFDSLLQALDPRLPIAEVEQAIASGAKIVADAIEGTARQVDDAVGEELQKIAGGVEASANAIGLELTRVLATGPVNDTIECTRERLGYYYDAAKEALDVTHATALFNELGESVLNSLSTDLPFDKIRDRLLPQLKDLDFSKLLPDFGGLKLEHLFPDLLAPNDGGENDWVRIRHGFDKDRLTAFADVDIDKVIEGTPEVFVLPPISLKLRQPHFLASSRLEISADGGKTQATKAALSADWLLCLSDSPVVTLREATLRYDGGGGFAFDVDAERVELAPELQFLTEALADLLPQEEGLTLTPVMPAGIRAELSLPLPDLTTGAFTLTSLTLHAFMELLIADGFEVHTGCSLSKPQRPFGLAILFLGGGGWVGVEVSYRPPARFETRVSIGISAGAFVAVNFGVAYGSAGILFTVGVDFYRDWQTQSGRTLITLGILVWGEFSILGIASASLRLMLSVTYDGSTGSMFGTGRVEVSIKICWCFTLRVSTTVRQQFAGSSQKRAAPFLAPPGGRDIYDRAVRAIHSNIAV
jgi:hypothetical protein